MRVSELEFDLYMRVDSNTNGHRQWFYFSMKNEKKCKVKLHIYRFKKCYSLFQRGMKPYVRSRKSGLDWKAGGQNVFYHYERQTNEYGVKKDTKNFVLTFTYTFQHENDEVFISAGIPYTYSFLQKQLNMYKQVAEHGENLKFELTNIGKTMCGLDLQLITIEHKMSSLLYDLSQKKSIIINARTHSGETPSSWVLDGFLSQVCSSKQIQEWMLADNISFKIVPMLNPDGVFIGNYRTGIIGDDFNRKFNSGKKQYYPQIFSLKKVVANCKRSGSVELFLDLHGHSVLKNSFIYGPAEGQFAGFKMKHLPFSLFHHSKYFRLGSCKFKSQNQNIETARIYFQLKEEILSYTCQNSLGLYYHQKQSFQMLSSDWQAFGVTLAHSMRESFKNKVAEVPKVPIYFKPSTTKSIIKPKIISEIQKKISEEESRTKSDYYVGKNNAKVHIKIPSLNKSKREDPKLDSIEKFHNNSISLSQQLTKDQKIQKLAEHFKLQKIAKIQKNESENSSKELNRTKFKIRRHSQIMKAPVCSAVISKTFKKSRESDEEELMMRKKSVDLEIQQFTVGRSSTFDTSYLKNEIQKIKDTQGYEQQCPYQMEVIKQNFSDEYSSMNDSDSASEDLKDQEKNYILQYIRTNQTRKEEKTEQNDSEEQTAAQVNFEAKINKFREIRFKSVEDPSSQKQMFKSSIKRVKLEPHKFRDNTAKSLKTKYSIMCTEFDDPSMVTITQKIKLNERANVYKRNQQDPFVLIQKKEKLH